MKLISIITPTYNHENFIKECIHSVINQTYKSWEMIIIDDNSIDKTLNIIKSYSKKDKRIKFISHNKRWGVKKLKDSYNQALKKSRGEIIAILEGDDFWPRDKLEKQIKVFKDSRVVLSFGNWSMCSINGKVIYTRNFKKFNLNYLNNNPPPSILNLFLTLKFDIGSQTVMIRKKTLERIGGFKTATEYPFVDIPTYLHLALRGKFAYIPETLGFYRRTNHSLWFNFASKSQTFGREEIKNCINNFIQIKAKSFSNTLNWNDIERKQNFYLLKRRILYPLSLMFNKFLKRM